MSDVPPSELHEQLRSFLDHMRKIKASDLYLIAAHPPVFRVDDVAYPARVPLDGDDIASMSQSLLNATQLQQLHSTLDMSVIFSAGDGDRFRASMFYQRGTPGMVVQHLGRLRTLEELGHIPELQQLALITRGLVLVVGNKRSGRSTALAAMIDHRNSSQPGHILTIEDPIEAIHTHKQCVVTQREIGVDAPSYASAIRAAPGQAADLIYVGAIDDAETMEAVLTLADDGHACLSTLHASTASQALERAVSFFAPERHAEIRMRLSRSLRAVVAQRLVPATPEGRVAAVELLSDTPHVQGLIRRGDFEGLAHLLDHGGEGCRSFDSSLLELCTAGRISVPEALKASEHRQELRNRLQQVRDGGHEAPLRLAAEPRMSVAEPRMSAPNTKR